MGADTILVTRTWKLTWTADQHSGTLYTTRTAPAAKPLTIGELHAVIVPDSPQAALGRARGARMRDTGDMCGRYADAREEEIVEAFDVRRILRHQEASANVCPTQTVRIVVDPAERPRQLCGARWGLVPSWARGIDGRPLINARAETVTAKPSFRQAAQRRRALVPAAGYYEWATGPEKAKTAYFLHPDDDGVLGFAGLYEWWRLPSESQPGLVDLSKLDDGCVADGWLCSTTIITRPATDALGAIHDRMPVVVPPDLVDAWLDPTLTSPDAVDALLAGIPDPVLVPTPRTP